MIEVVFVSIFLAGVISYGIYASLVKWRQKRVHYGKLAEKLVSEGYNFDGSEYVKVYNETDKLGIVLNAHKNSVQIHSVEVRLWIEELDERQKSKLKALLDENRFVRLWYDNALVIRHGYMLFAPSVETIFNSVSKLIMLKKELGITPGSREPNS